MGEPRKLMLLLKTTAQERKIFLLRDSVDSVKQIKKICYIGHFAYAVETGTVS